MPKARPTSPQRERATYHHGDLRAALVDAGYALARQGGVDAVVLREVTRRAGVTARAAYRHFDSREALLLAVASPALAQLARTIERELAQVDEREPRERALASLRAVGMGYIAYALDEPGGFDIAFFGLVTMADSTNPQAAGDSGHTPYQLLTGVLEELVTSGLIEPSRRAAAATYCWSAVHGFAALATRGPIRDLPRAALDAMAGELVAATAAGLVGIRSAAPEPTG